MHPMAKIYLVLALFLALPFVRAEVLTSLVVKGSVTCLDCSPGSDLSGIQVRLTCNEPEKVGVAYTGEDGAFETKLPSDKGARLKDSSSCMAKIMGGTHQLYAFTRKNPVFFPIANQYYKESGKYRIPKPLTFYQSCPVEGKCGGKNGKGSIGSSKTLDMPFLGQWGLAPSSYYIPFFPIIGIP